ncbi:FAD binding domain-containing protein [Anaerolineales bacterium HSG6]|nr:FAD binding domain-containing protein [Anaerolineales bacterium HSG6]
MWQTYYTPRSINETLDLLAEHREEAPRLMAGGTDLVVEIERGIHVPKLVIDISAIPGLDTITKDENNHIHLGPLVTHNQVVRSRLCVDRAFPIVQACWSVGAPQIRNRGTVAGNVATASPANDTIPALYALGASLTLQNCRGSRTVPITEFFQGPRKTVIEPDEMLVDISFPILSDYQIGTFVKLGLRQAQAISIVNVGIVLSMFADTVTNARIALGSVAPTVIRATDAERFLAGKIMTQEVIERAGALAAQIISPISDVRGTSEYRRYIAETLTRHALQSLTDGTEADMMPRHPVTLWGKTDGSFASDEQHQMTIHSKQKNEPIETTINGETKTFQGANCKTLLRMLREDAGLTGTKEGCAEGECGACTVIMNGIAVMSCLVPAPRAHHCDIRTIEGLAEGDELHPLQQAFIDESAVQCGYCTPGFLMSGTLLMDEKRRPSHDDIKQAVTGNLCRCTGYYKILRALEKACGLDLSLTRANWPVVMK